MSAETADIHSPAQSLYPAHFDALTRTYDQALAKSGFDAVVIGAGVQTMRFLDDQPLPFRANPLLQQWLPLQEHPQACLLYRPGSKPQAMVVTADDYWHQAPPVPARPWNRLIDVLEVSDAQQAWDALGSLPARTALLGPPAQWLDFSTRAEANPAGLLNRLHYSRAVKSGWEVECIAAANRRAVLGHRAAASALAAGGTEFDILLAFLGACGQTADELPYPAIVAGDVNAATLHYQFYQRDLAPVHSLLIDAGCQQHGYASDVTRSYAMTGNTEFADLLAAMEQVQLRLCALVRPGLAFAELQTLAHREIAGLLSTSGLVKASPEAILDAGLTSAFFPHGLGHLLGLQVHDVGGHLADPDGSVLQAPADYPRLRLLRTLEPGFVLTIEPGLYFIPSLLEPLKKHALGRQIDWVKIERLGPSGGIRIEDNVCVTADGADNLTRTAFLQ